MSLLLPIPPRNPHFTMGVQLDGLFFDLEFFWSMRGAEWLVSLATSAGDVVFSGRSLKENWPVWRGVQDVRLPGGALTAIDTNLALAGASTDVVAGFGTFPYLFPMLFGSGQGGGNTTAIGDGAMTVENLGTRFQVVYVTEEELAALGGA